MSVARARIAVSLFFAFALLLGLGLVDSVIPLRAIRDVSGATLWYVDWALLSRPGTQNSELVFQARSAESWAELPMATWYPARWEGRLRWDRERVEQSVTVRRPFLVAACVHSGAREVRLVRRRWPRQPGEVVQSRAKLTETVIDTRSCALPFPDAPRWSI